MLEHKINFPTLLFSVSDQFFEFTTRFKGVNKPISIKDNKLLNKNREKIFCSQLLFVINNNSYQYIERPYK